VDAGNLTRNDWLWKLFPCTCHKNASLPCASFFTVLKTNQLEAGQGIEKNQDFKNIHDLIILYFRLNMGKVK
jgi:hypothetical protein